MARMQMTWFAGSFSSQEALDAWLNDEKTIPYWNSQTQTQIDDKSTTIVENFSIEIKVNNYVKNTY